MPSNHAFDVPFLEGRDLTACTLLDRKAMLRDLIPEPESPAAGAIRFSEHFGERGEEIFREASRLGFGGVVAKLKNGRYHRGRSGEWLKIKASLRQEVVIGGYKAAVAAVKTAEPAAPQEPAITHPDRKLWPEDGYTKRDLADYYRAVAPILLPHLRDRPLILKRFPGGIASPPFYQHDVKNAPPFVKIQPVKEADGSLVHYALCQNPETLLWLASLAVIPQNPWLSRVPHLERPDWIVFDLDPQEVPFPEVCGMALYLKEILDGLGLKAFAKTSGSRGIHIYLPVKPAYDFSQALDFAQRVAAHAVAQKPDAFTVERSLKIRKRDRIYLDCMQNSAGKSVVSVYSVRERPEAPVSAALEWAELKKKIRIEDFTLRTMPKRLEKKGDLFLDVLKVRSPLEGALKKLLRS
ncbi:MAG TPA: non-homologous end-joining DNA ligase [Fibrobacteria bacterium]|nr:non-homologous end-joining DNA ligase [Fibrobacteria bacterium]